MCCREGLLVKTETETDTDTEIAHAGITA